MRKYFSNIQKNNFKHSILVFLFLLIALVGVFGYGKDVGAQALPDLDAPKGECTVIESFGTELDKPVRYPNQTQAQCTEKGGTWNPYNNSGNPAPKSSSGNAFQDAINAENCGIGFITGGSLGGCILKTAYYVWFQIPSLLLQVSALFFNALTALVLQSTMYTHGFISDGWGVVRDLSNIFFILILLYIALKTVMSMGGHETKSMITSVIIMAILINFSLFFTKIVIDSSNILALIFYNKLDTKYVDSSGKSILRPEVETIKGGAKDVSGSLYEKFDATKLVSPGFIAKLKTGKVNNIIDTDTKTLPVGATVGIMIIAGTIMLFAAYTFFTSGIFFIGRIIELWLLMIFAPFAFMSFAVPKLAHTEYGWDKWSDKLISTSFMAPIFMFFLYLIFKLLGTEGFFSSFLYENNKAGWMADLLGILLPALIILGMLLKAKDLAKKGGGQFGEMVMTGAKVAGGLALGATALGGAVAGRATVGALMKGASTGDTAANRMVGAAGRIAAQRAIISNPNSDVVDRTQAKKAIWRERKDQIQGNVERFVGVQGLRNRIGPLINKDQHNIEHAKHARHELDEAAGKIAHGKKWEELNGEQRYQARRQVARDKVIREHAANGTVVQEAIINPATHQPVRNAAGQVQTLGAINPLTGQPIGAFGSRGWDKMSTEEKRAIDRTIEVGNDFDSGHAIEGLGLHQKTTVADDLINDSKSKQGLISTVVQSSVGGTYDIRNLAKVIAKEQSTGVSKAAMMLAGAVAIGMRGALKQSGANHGEAQGNFFKDIGNTVSDALKSAKINVDLSHVGEEKKEDHKGGGGAHH